MLELRSLWVSLVFWRATVALGIQAQAQAFPLSLRRFCRYPQYINQPTVSSWHVFKWDPSAGKGVRHLHVVVPLTICILCPPGRRPVLQCVHQKEGTEECLWGARQSGGGCQQVCVCVCVHVCMCVCVCVTLLHLWMCVNFSSPYEVYVNQLRNHYGEMLYYTCK